MHDQHRRFTSAQFTIPLAALLAFCLFLSDGYCQSAQQKAQLYFFTNAACAPCRQVEPELEKLYRAGYPVMKIDTQLHPDWTQRFQIQRTPTVVLVANQKVVERHSGMIDAATMQGWFAKLQPEPRIATTVDQPTTSQTPGLPKTCLKGTSRPSTASEQRAMQATVRLKVDDDEGSSYATGTVIHYHNGDALVLTCGHVFRESKGAGVISAEYGFDGDVRKIATGELLGYDADARDIALVAIKTSDVFEPIEIAPVNFRIEKRDEIFSIGCDNGAVPTIRHSLIKNQAKYDGIEKYEIYGRPVNGRSGGGLFTTDGKLVGVCNAAVVDVDEGVYVALDTIHWQFEQANLAHLFQQRPESQIQRGAVASRADSRRRDFSEIPVGAVKQFSSDGNVTLASNEIRNQRRVPQNDAQDGMELIVVVKSDVAGTESFTINNPSPELMNRLRTAQQQIPANDSVKSRLARLRRDMPNLQSASGNNYRTADMRAQSPRW